MDAFRDRIAVVTGGASGIGRALCLQLAERGAQVVVADLNSAGAAEVVAEIQRSGGKAEAHSVDVTNWEAVDAFTSGVATAHGRIDYLFNNAGIGVAGEECDVTLADWQRVLAVNLWGVVHGVHAVYPRMLQQGCGHIVNTASLAGLSPAPLQMSYVASKHAVVGLSCALRVEAADRGVRVSVVCPGLVDTPILHNIGVRGMDAERLRAVVATTTKAISAEACARVILRGVEKNKPIIVVTRAAYVAWLLTRLSPRAAMWGWRTVFLARVRRAMAGAAPR